MTNNFILQKAPSSSCLTYRKSITSSIFIGSDLLFSSRLYANLKRHIPVISYDISQAECTSSGYLFSIDQLLSLARYREVDTIILSSELFFFADQGFIQAFIKSLKKFSDSYRPIKIVFCKIDFPSPLASDFLADFYIEAITSAYSSLQSLNSIFLSLLDNIKHLVLEFSAFIPSAANSHQLNFLLSPSNINRSLEVLNSCFPVDLAFYSCDDLSKLLLDYFYSEGYLSVQHSYKSASLASFSSAVSNQSSIRKYLCELPSFSHDFDEYHCKNLVSQFVFPSFPQSYCSLDVVYRNKPVSISHFSEIITASTRLKLGTHLAQSIPNDIKGIIDFISPVPETGKYYAQGLAKALNVPYLESLIKAKDIGRSFDIQNSSARRDFIQNKLAVIPELLEGKNVGFVDEAIFTGSTLRIVSEILAKTNIKSVFFFIPTPECTQRCPFNMQPDRNMLSEYIRADALPSYFDVNGVFFQDESVFESIIYNDHGSLCTLCFSSS